jgi:hypothetical protein
MKPRMPPMIPNENNTIKLKLLTQPNCLLTEKKKDKNANGIELMLTMATNIFQNLGFIKIFTKSCGIVVLLSHRSMVLVASQRCFRFDVGK